MFKVSDSAFVQVIFNSGKSGTQRRDFGIDLL